MQWFVFDANHIASDQRNLIIDYLPRQRRLGNYVDWSTQQKPGAEGFIAIMAQLICISSQLMLTLVRRIVGMEDVGTDLNFSIKRIVMMGFTID